MIETLPFERAESNFRDIEPTAMPGRVDEFSVCPQCAALFPAEKFHIYVAAEKAALPSGGIFQ